MSLRRGTANQTGEMMGQAYDIKYADTTQKAYETKHVHAIGWAYTAEPHNDNVVVIVVVVVVVVVIVVVVVVAAAARKKQAN